MRKAYLLVILILCAVPMAEGLAVESNLSISSTAFKDQQAIPSRYTCHGLNISPPLIISHIPESARSFVLIMHEPDSPQGDLTHWVVYNIKPQTSRIAQGAVPGQQLINDFQSFNYAGPCPNDGKLHHYHFDLYALTKNYEPNPNSSATGLKVRINNDILAKASLVGTYQ